MTDFRADVLSVADPLGITIEVDGVEQEVTRLTKGIATAETRYQLEAKEITPNGLALSLSQKHTPIGAADVEKA